MIKEKVIVIDFGGQYNQLVARRVRECNVYCEIYSYKTPIEKIKEINPKGIILTGGPNSCYEEGAPTCTAELFGLGIPVLGLCYGAQLMQHVLGGKVEKAPVREYGKINVFVNADAPVFAGIKALSDNQTAEIKECKTNNNSNVSDESYENTRATICWMSHNDYISKIAPGFEIIAHTSDCPVAAAMDEKRGLYAIQFHPEVLHTVCGKDMLFNFVRKICSCSGSWRMDSYVEETIKSIKEKVGNGKVLLALSGGVDSSVAAGLLARAIGKQLTCVFIDHGLLRKNEGDEVEAVFGNRNDYTIDAPCADDDNLNYEPGEKEHISDGRNEIIGNKNKSGSKAGGFSLNFIKINAKERYYKKLAGVADPEQKRKIIGEEFIRIFEEESKKIGAVDFLAQGTIYPDVVESGLGGESAVIKSHHNVGGLPDYVDFKEIIEPLRNLFKDEVRQAGLELGLPKSLVFRQPFPGPGLGIRIIGEVTAEKVRIVQDADYIYREELEKAYASGRDDFKKLPDQYFAALTNMRSVGVMGDERTYDYAVALRAVETVDFMTAEASQIPYDILNKVMTRIVNEVKGVNRVFYEITSKPPGTIEFE